MNNRAIFIETLRIGEKTLGLSFTDYNDALSFSEEHYSETSKHFIIIQLMILYYQNYLLMTKFNSIITCKLIIYKAFHCTKTNLYSSKINLNNRDIKMHTKITEI